MGLMSLIIGSDWTPFWALQNPRVLRIGKVIGNWLGKGL